ncbi:glycosyltransferase [Pseudarthrobacter sp. BIM B-2242]|nr:glycosyltransferase [Pseudarthrobacter sp. BIM B-2242]QOD02634.1 glycosyltransferase [Pseudarthrobacter sp. BIM B-2242]
MSSDISGGGEQYLYRLYSHLVKDGRVTVDLVGSLPQWPKVVGAVRPVGRSPKLTRRRGLIFQIFSLVAPMINSYKIAKRKSYDVIHVQYFKEKLTLPFFLRGLPILWTEHGPLPENFPPGGLRLLARQSRYCSVVAVSKGVSESLLSQGISSRVIPNPMPSIDVGGVQVERRPPAATSLLFAGRLHRSKRIELLIEAARLKPEIQVLIAGDGPDRGYYESISPENVQFLGLVTPVLPVVASCSAVVITSGREAREGSPMIMLEARRLGVPVLIAEDCHAASEARELLCTTFYPTGEGLAKVISDAASLVSQKLPEASLRLRSEKVWADAHYSLIREICRDGSRS